MRQAQTFPRCDRPRHGSTPGIRSTEAPVIAEAAI